MKGINRWTDGILQSLGNEEHASTSRRQGHISHGDGDAMHKNGYTLLETLITLTIASIIALGSLSSFSTLHDQLRLRSYVQHLSDTIATARNEAGKQNQRVTIRKNRQEWQSGWVMFIDSNGNTLRDTDEAMLLEGSSVAPWVRVHSTQSLSDHVTYLPNGTAALKGGGFQAGTLTICSLNASLPGFQLIINNIGRVRVVELDDPGSCT